MERECFENQQTADIMNKYFVSVKVDKEERPDVDHIYMDVCQMLTRSGGWPLSIFMTPGQQPFFAGTYFPKRSRYGMQGFDELLKELHRLWKSDREKISIAQQEIMSILRRDHKNTAGLPDENIIRENYEEYRYHFDSKYGGMKGAPKFPTPHHLYFLMRIYYAFHELEALEMAQKTLTAMYCGGIYDHVGYGFCRYSTDEKWLVPHFEKMLYDNAWLATAYTEMYQITKDDFYKKAAKEILQFAERDLRVEEGGFLTAIDADSQGVEGSYYLWTKEEIWDILGSEDGELFCAAYGINEEGNFEEGKNIPNLIQIQSGNFEILREALFQARCKRIPPHTDDKILTGQNGMMLAALFMAGRAFGESKYLTQGRQVIEFIENKLVSQSGRLLAVYRDGQAKLPAYASDYAYYIRGLIEAYYATGDNLYLQRADSLNEQLLDLFWDEEKGGLFLYGSDGEHLIIRPKEVHDGAYPSANSIAALNFIQLSRLMHNPALFEKAEDIVKAFGHQLQQYGLGSAQLLNAYLYMLTDKSSELVLAGSRENKNYYKLERYVKESFLPFTTLQYDFDCKQYKTIGNNPTIYVCHGHTCSPPVDTREELAELLKF